MKVFISADMISIEPCIMSLRIDSFLPITSGVPHLSLKRLPPSGIAFVHSSNSFTSHSAKGR